VVNCFWKGATHQVSELINGFSEKDIALLDEVAETILPKTNTPGAKDAAVGVFITVMVNDCYTPQDQQVFREGMVLLNDACQNKFNTDFMKATKEERHAVLLSLDREAKVYQEKVTVFNNEQNEKEQEEFERGNLAFKKSFMSSHYYTMMKQLTLLGFFTSEKGATEALRYVPVPGRYDACIPYHKGDRAWA
jgi:hypothetical protein